MDLQKSNGLMALVAYGASDIYLHGNPQISIFQDCFKRTTNSSFTYNVIDFYKNNNNSYSCVIENNKINADLLGSCYLSIVLKNILSTGEKNNLYNIIKNISVKIADNQETLTGDTLEVIAEQFLNKTKVEYEDLNIIFPLPFYFTRNHNSYLPIIAIQLLETRFDCVFNDAISNNIEKVQLLYKSIYLDITERKLFKNINENVFDITETTNYENIHIVSNSKDEYIKHSIILDFTHPVKDIRIFIKSNLVEECVGQINIRLNNQDKPHISLNALMAKKIIPRQLYNIENKKSIYYIPFCQDPCSLRYRQTSQINFNRIDKAILEIYLKPSIYNISIIAQYINVMRYSNGLCDFINI
jgi:hypothetical protein